MSAPPVPRARRLFALALALAPALLGAARAAADGGAPRADARAVYDGSLRPDALVEAFRHSDTLFPSAVVHRHGPVRALPSAAKPLPALHFRSRGRAVDLPDYLALNRVAGLLILKRGEVVLEDYELGLTPADHWPSFSIAKSVSSTLTGIALAQKHIRSLEDPVARYVPELASGGYAKVRVRDVLEMASGVAWNETYTDPGSDRRAVLDLQLAPTHGRVLAYMAARPTAAPPGSVWNYNTGETFVIGAVLSAAVGEPLPDYLSATIWSAAGMEDDATWWWVESPGGLTAAGTGLAARLRDYGRFGLFVLEDGVAAGRHWLPAGWLAEATSPKTIGGKPVDYGYLWWPLPAGDPIQRGAYAAQGIFGQRVYVNPAESLVVVILSAQPKPTDSEVVDDDDFLAAVAHALH